MYRIITLICLCLFSGSMLAQESETADFSALVIKSHGKDGEMLDFAVSQDQRYIAVANENEVIKLYDGRTGRFVKRIQGYHGDLIEILISPDNDRLITAGFDNSIAVIDIQSGELINTIMLKNRFRCLVIDEGGDMAVVGDLGGVITFVDLQNFEIVKEIKSGVPQVTSLGFSPDFKQIAAGTGISLGYMLKKNPILLIDADTKEVTKKLSGLPGATTALRYSYDGKSLYTGHKSNSRTLMKWDLASGSSESIARIVNLVSIGGYTSLDVDENNSVIIATTDDHSIQIYDLVTNKPVSYEFAAKIRLIRKLDHFPRNVFGINKGKNFIIGGFSKSLLYIYNAEKKGVAGYIHLYDDDWAVVAADGRMDGSLEAIKNLGWKAGFFSIPLENTFDANFTPRLLNELLAATQTRGEFKVEETAKEIPVLKVNNISDKAFDTKVSGHNALRSTQKNIVVNVTINENAHQIEEVRLHHNSKLIKTIKPAPGQTLRDIQMEASLTDAFGQENFFYVTAKTKQGFESEKSTFIVLYDGKTEEKARLFLLTVGVNQYRNAKYNLNYAVADANAFEKEIKNGGTTLFDKVIVTSIRDNKALKPNLLSAFEEIRRQSREQDVFIFYYAGHGVMSDGSSTDPQFYIIPHDITQLYGRNDLLQEKGLSAEELKELSKNINAQKQVFILDACQSAGAIDGMSTRGAAEEKAMAQLARSTGTFWITASGSEQFATEFAELGHGVFTYSLLEGLGGKADNGDKRITIKELSAYIENRVPELSEKYKGTPQFPSGFSFGNDFPIVIVP